MTTSGFEALCATSYFCSSCEPLTLFVDFIGDFYVRGFTVLVEILDGAFGVALAGAAEAGLFLAVVVLADAPPLATPNFLIYYSFSLAYLYFSYSAS